MPPKLYLLDDTLKKFLLTFLLLLTSGLVSGLVYLFSTTNFAPEKTVIRYAGEQKQGNEDEFDIPETYPKPFSEMLLTTHTHLLGFAFIFFPVGLLFYCNSVLVGGWKLFLLVEPMLSILITFSSLWAVRYLSPVFVYVTITSGLLTYLSYFIMTGILFYELAIRRPD